MLVMAFTYAAHWLPAFGATGIAADALSGWSRLVDRLRHLALPLTTLTLIGIGGLLGLSRRAFGHVRTRPSSHTASTSRGNLVAGCPLPHSRPTTPHPL